MKNLLILFLLAAVILTTGCSSSNKDKSAGGLDLSGSSEQEENIDALNFGMVPSSNVGNMNEQLIPLQRYLRRRIGKEITLKFERNYKEVIRHLGDDIDLALMGAYSYVKASESVGAKVLVKSVRYGTSYYNSVIMVRKDSGINEIADLKGKSIVFTDILSTSGYLYPIAAIIKAGLDIKKDIQYSFVKGHDNAVKHVYLGTADACGCFENAHKQFLSESGSKELKVLEVVGKIPSDPIVVNKRVFKDKELFEKLKKAFLELDIKKDKKVLNALSGKVEGYVEATDTDYDLLRKNIKLVEKTAK